MSYLQDESDSLPFFAPLTLQRLLPHWEALLEKQTAVPVQVRSQLLKIRLLLGRGNLMAARSALLGLQQTHPGPLWLHWLALVAAAAGDYATAHAWLLQEQDTLPLFDAACRSDNAYALAWLALQQERQSDAIACLRTALLQARFATDPGREARARQAMGQIAARRQLNEMARDHYLCARDALNRAHDDQGLASLEGLIRQLPRADAC